MGCSNCPPSSDSEWLTCTECDAKYVEYDSMFHSMLCPRCAKIRIQQRALATASQRRMLGSFVTNEVPNE